ncbi:MAG: OmpH family outer membrane protein [Pirellulaceae bacterium]|nr:OmpH family outer membrane protein [Pirellulaceae bacterium]
MRIRRFVFTMVAGLSLMTTVAHAQQPAQGGAPAQAAAAQPRATIPVAVIDLGYILNNHPTMKAEIEQVKAQSETVGAEFEKKRQAILKMMEELRENYTEGTPDYAKKEQEIAAQDTDFRLQVVRKNKEFDEKRAQIFFTVHAQVTGLVKHYCSAMGTLVVLKVSREKPDPKKPQTIETAMMQEVFYHQDAPNVDITNWVLESLKAQAGSAMSAPMQSAGRPGAGAGTLK